MFALVRCLSCRDEVTRVSLFSYSFLAKCELAICSGMLISALGLAGKATDSLKALCMEENSSSIWLELALALYRQNELADSEKGLWTAHMFVLSKVVTPFGSEWYMVQNAIIQWRCAVCLLGAVGSASVS